MEEAGMLKERLRVGIETRSLSLRRVRSHRKGSGWSTRDGRSLTKTHPPLGTAVRCSKSARGSTRAAGGFRGSSVRPFCLGRGSRSGQTLQLFRRPYYEPAGLMRKISRGFRGPGSSASGAKTSRGFRCPDVLRALPHSRKARCTSFPDTKAYKADCGDYKASQWSCPLSQRASDPGQAI